MARRTAAATAASSSSVRLIVRHLSSKEKVNALAETVTVPKAGHAYNAASAGEDDIDQARLAYEPAPRHSGLSAA